MDHHDVAHARTIEAAIVIGMRMGANDDLNAVVSDILREILAKLSLAGNVAAIDEDFEVAVFDERAIAISARLLNRKDL